MTRADALRWGRGDRRRLSRRDYPPAVLALIDERLGGRYCVECRELGVEPPPGEDLEVDHLQPHSQEGDNHHLNLTWRCRSHNRGRGVRSALAPARVSRAARKRRCSA